MYLKKVHSRNSSCALNLISTFLLMYQNIDDNSLISRSTVLWDIFLYLHCNTYFDLYLEKYQISQTMKTQLGWSWFRGHTCCCLRPSDICFSYINGVNKDDVRFVLDQILAIDFSSSSSLKQESAGRHITTLEHVIPILSQPVFVLTPWCRQAANTNFVVFNWGFLTYENKSKLHCLSWLWCCFNSLFHNWRLIGVFQIVS